MAIIVFKHTACASTCGCPYTSDSYGGWCKHIVAALLTYINAPEQVEERPPLADLLAELNGAMLRDLLLDLAAHDPDVVDRAVFSLSPLPW